MNDLAILVGDLGEVGHGDEGHSCVSHGTFGTHLKDCKEGVDVTSFVSHGTLYVTTAACITR